MKASYRAALGLFLLAVSIRLALGQPDPAWIAHYTESGYATNPPVCMQIDGQNNIYVAGFTQNGPMSSNGWILLKYDAQGNYLWSTTFGGSTGEGDRPTAMALDSSGNILVAGYCYSPGSGNDFALVKFDPAGNVLWTRFYNGPGNGDDRAKAIALDAQGNIFVTGQAYVSTTTWPSGTSTTDTSYLTLKYDSDGNLLWAQPYAATLSNQDGQSLAIDGSGNVYVAGISVFYADPRAPGARFAVLKYAPNGSLLQQLRYQLTVNTDGRGATIRVALGPSNIVYVAGTMAPMLPQSYIVLKYTNDVQQWVQSYYGVNPYGTGGNFLQAVAVDPVANAYVTGWSPGTNNAMDCATVKWGPDGTQLWALRHNLTGTNNEYARAMVLDAQTNLYVAAFSQGASNGYVTLKYSASGDGVWETHFAAPGQAWNDPKAMALDSRGNVVITGASASFAGIDCMTIKYTGPRLVLSATNGLFAISFSGFPGATYRIEYSSDLQTWHHLGLVVADAQGLGSIVDPTPPLLNTRFYRAIPP